MAPRNEPKTVSAQIADLYEQLRRVHTMVTAATGAPPAGEQGPPGLDGTDGRPGTDGTDGPPGPAATVEAFEEGVSLGTFDTIDFVGAAITASVVGTDLIVTVASTASSVLEDARYRMMVAV